MSNRVFEAESEAVQLPPWRECAHARDEASCEPRRAVFDELPADPAESGTSAEAPADGLRASWQEGFRAGQTAAIQKYEAEVRERTEQLARTISEIAGLRSEMLNRAEAEIVRLALAIARRALHRELSADPSARESLIKAALEKLKQQEIYRVRICPGEEQLMLSCLEQAGRGQAVEVVADPSQPPGGAYFEISRGALDASIDTQLAEIERGLLDQLRIRGAL